MCNGHSTRVSQGGSIAVLRPSSHSHATPHADADADAEIRVFFSNDAVSPAADQPGTQVQLHGLERDRHALDDRWMVIQ